MHPDHTCVAGECRVSTMRLRDSKTRKGHHPREQHQAAVDDPAADLQQEFPGDLGDLGADEEADASPLDAPDPQGSRVSGGAESPPELDPDLRRTKTQLTTDRRSSRGGGRRLQRQLLVPIDLLTGLDSMCRPLYVLYEVAQNTSRSASSGSSIYDGGMPPRAQCARCWPRQVSRNRL